MMRCIRKKSRDNARTVMQWNDGPFADLETMEYGLLLIPIIRRSMSAASWRMKIPS